MNGPPKFIIIIKNQKIEKLGFVLIAPLLINILREWARSYSKFAIANIPEDTRPWANMIHQAPLKPLFSSMSKFKIIRAMWTTEE